MNGRTGAKRHVCQVQSGVLSPAALATLPRTQLYFVLWSYWALAVAPLTYKQDPEGRSKDRGQSKSSLSPGTITLK